MRLLNRLLLYLLLIAGLARMVFYFIDAAALLPIELESHNLEAKMVLLAYRAHRGLSLYPAWMDYPHVANFFGPVYFALAGLLGRACDADIRGLFLVGRGISFLAGLSTTLVVMLAIGRRYGRGAGVAGGLLSLGSVPMYGFTTMVRPDALAELFGAAGYFLSEGRGRWTRLAGLLLLVLAILTKQTAGIFLLAAALAPALAGERRRALGVLAGGVAVLLVVVASVNVAFEPHFAASLLGEAGMPWDYVTWRRLLGRIVVTAPDLLLLPSLGLVYWMRARPPEIGPATLSGVLLASALGLSWKLGADSNYYLSLRIAEALTVGILWRAGHSVAPRSIARSIALAVTLLLVLASLVPSLIVGAFLSQLAWREVAANAVLPGRSYLLSIRSAIAQMQDPELRILTDSGLLDLYQGERAAFGDPWLFHNLVETGRLRPLTMERRIRSQYYDLIITTHDFESPDYVHHDFRLPMVLVEQARSHYVLNSTQVGLFFYVRRGESGRPPSATMP